MVVELGMFPLGSVLFPSQVLPLHVFEPRYLAMMRRCLDGGDDFGVVLIERGSEVGGGDVRSGVGTVARIVETATLPGGRLAVAAVGTRRLRVLEWLPDDPYPRALVEDFADADADDDAGTAGAEARWAGVVAAMRRALAMSAELGETAVPATIEVADDPALGTYQVAAVAPLGPADQYRVLAASTVAARIVLLDRLLGEAVELLHARLSSPG